METTGGMENEEEEGDAKVGNTMMGGSNGQGHSGGGEIITSHSSSSGTTTPGGAGADTRDRGTRLDRKNVETLVDTCRIRKSDATVDDDVSTTATTTSRVVDRVVLDDLFEELHARYLDALHIVDPIDFVESDETVVVVDADLFVGLVVVTTSSSSPTSSSGRYDDDGHDDTRRVDGENETSIATIDGSDDGNCTSIMTMDGRDVIGVDINDASMTMTMTTPTASSRYGLFAKRDFEYSETVHRSGPSTIYFQDDDAWGAYLGALPVVEIDDLDEGADSRPPSLASWPRCTCPVVEYPDRDGI